MRAPELGRVKSRLAAEIGAERALAVYRELGARAVATAAALPESELRIAFTPADGGEAVREWLGAGGRALPQCDGDLGCRMAAASGEAFADGAERVVIIGSDCPGLATETLARAFALLDDADVVLGPATDGGYYLVGLAAPRDELFDGIPWSTPDTLRVTLEVARARGLRVALLDEKRDIDTADDWRHWQAMRARPTR